MLYIYIVLNRFLIYRELYSGDLESEWVSRVLVTCKLQITENYRVVIKYLANERYI